MNLDERIEAEIVKYGYGVDSQGYDEGREEAQAAVKQLIRDVLEYVKPERELAGILVDGKPIKADILITNNNRIIDEMEAKQKELGL